VPGMNAHPISLTNPFVVAIFHHALFFDAALWWAGLTFIVLLVATLTGGLLRFNLSPSGVAEARGRRLLRHGFGALWLIDGLLQFQPAMPLGLGSNVVAPAATGTPGWLHHLMSHGVALWYEHPVAFAVGVAWIEVGLGLVLLSSNGLVGRAVAGLSALYAAGIWLVGNGAGGIFVHGASLLFGWPGATFFYALAGVWLALDPAVLERRFAPVTSRILAALLAVALILQCLPDAEFWHGGPTNGLTAMTRYMTQVPQPHALAWVVRRAGDLAALMGGGFNVVILLWLGATAVGLWMSHSRGWRWPSWSLAAGSLVLWVIAQDGAIFGGLATDLNSLIPLAFLGWAVMPGEERRAREPRLARELLASSSAVVASFGVAMAAFAVVSMTLATTAGAENTLYVARNGPVSPAAISAAPFTLTDQFAHPYRLGEHAGHATVLAFLDPKCWTDCPLIAAQLRELRTQLSPNAPLDIVAVAINPYHETLSDLRSFIRAHQLSDLKNFFFVTGPLKSLRRVWNEYGIGVSMKPTAKMSVHSDYLFIIDSHQQVRWVVPDDPIATSPGTASAVTQLRTLLARQGIS
jgi:cytochrome oxidase Cu insertion factor (SCO1/SenC/PrrC family)